MKQINQSKSVKKTEHENCFPKLLIGNKKNNNQFKNRSAQCENVCGLRKLPLVQNFGCQVLRIAFHKVVVVSLNKKEMVN
jgi:hypothetical protein